MRTGSVIPRISQGEETFLFWWKQLAPDLPLPEREYPADLARKWLMDFYWPNAYVAVEIDGHGHRRANRYFSDLEKYNALASQDVLLFRTTPQLIEADPETFIKMVKQAIARRLVIPLQESS